MAFALLKAVSCAICSPAFVHVSFAAWTLKMLLGATCLPKLATAAAPYFSSNSFADSLFHIRVLGLVVQMSRHSF